MSGPPPATAATRLAVRRSLAGNDPVTAAVSGGADSLALAAALAFERPGSSAAVVDHGLQPGSDEVAAKAAAQCEGLGLRATVLRAPRHQGAEQRGGNVEARARELRYSLLDRVEGFVLLGHTRDDQAETVLLGILRGSGARALSGMAPVRGHYRRPFLELTRAQTRAACLEAGLTPWEDPHNTDPGFDRVRFRQLLDALPAAGLARTAKLLREDADALDALATPTGDVPALLALPAALRSRSLKLWAEQQCGRAVTSAHVDALRALVEGWHGQGPVALPGGGRVARVSGRLAFSG
ncbi:MAG: tRNA(Ile)-lysidine synthetase [Frankiales bacterium]|nr:tRNA(Ile)-lysidine synthetase [Frankiales bacterium]